MHKIPIPRMGGLAIFFAFLIAVLCFAGIDRELRGILLGATIIVVLGILDDILTLKALPKFAVQIVAAVIAVLHGCRIEHFYGLPSGNVAFLSRQRDLDRGHHERRELHRRSRRPCCKACPRSRPSMLVVGAARAGLQLRHPC